MTNQRNDVIKKLISFIVILLSCLTSTANSTSKQSTAPCGVCQGSGVIVCLLCSGAGGSQQWRCLTYPPYTQYYEWVNCMACGGTGMVYCTWCKGTGVVNVIQSSGGNNYNYNNSGSYNYNSNSNSSSYDTCRICGGTGVCTSCNGTGGEWRDTGYYTGSGNKSWIDCPSCNGNKKCFNCRGTGRQ